MPRPNVGSAVINLTLHEKPPIPVTNEKLLFKLIRASFNQRRKTLVNGLNNSQELSFSKDEIQAALESLKIPANIRGEALTLEQFASLANTLSM
jgi:16S rRNA (adenine1518-N6/adenine1519-N6)-dimethyltransferase